MHFNVVPEKLGVPVVAEDLGIRFQPPAGWEPLSSAAFDSVSHVLDRSDEALRLHPRHIFLDPRNGSLCSVTTVAFADSLGFDAMIARYGALIADRYQGDSLRQGLFYKDNIRMVQYLLQPQDRVAFKLLFETPVGGVIQFDYIVPKLFYAGEVKAIESSIGSIQRID